MICPFCPEIWWRLLAVSPLDRRSFPNLARSTWHRQNPPPPVRVRCHETVAQLRQQFDLLTSACFSFATKRHCLKPRLLLACFFFVELSHRGGQSTAASASGLRPAVHPPHLPNSLRLRLRLRFCPSARSSASCPQRQRPQTTLGPSTAIRCLTAHTPSICRKPKVVPRRRHKASASSGLRRDGTMSDEDFTAAGGANNPQHTPGKHRGPRFSWTPAYEATFFRSLCESVQLGLREGSTFKVEAWHHAIQALIDRHGAYAQKSHLINKSDNARKKFRLWRGLREDPEFRYDRATRTVTASEDAWKRHLEVSYQSQSLLLTMAQLTHIASTERATCPLPQGPTVRPRRLLRGSLSRCHWVRRRAETFDQAAQEGP